MFYQTLTARRPPKGPKNAILTRALPFSCSFLQTRPSEGPNTSSEWIWRKSSQRFPRYFVHKPWRGQKTEPSAVDCVR